MDKDFAKLGSRYLSWFAAAGGDPLSLEKLERIPDAWLDANPDAARRMRARILGEGDLA